MPSDQNLIEFQVVILPIEKFVFFAFFDNIIIVSGKIAETGNSRNREYLFGYGFRH